MQRLARLPYRIVRSLAIWYLGLSVLISMCWMTRRARHSQGAAVVPLPPDHHCEIDPDEVPRLALNKF